MIQINNLKLPPGFTQEELWRTAAKKLHLPPEQIETLQRRRQSLDARNKQRLHYNISVTATVKSGAHIRMGGDIQPFQPKEYQFPTTKTQLSHAPVVVGSGPAGIFCALMLARAGLKPILVEQGAHMEQRVRDVSAFFATGNLNTKSNIQFGEGGAGTFSDGKLTTGTRDIRQRFVLEQFVQHGAPEDILYLAKPHIGTDKLRTVVAAMRDAIIAHGGQVMFGCTLTGIAHKGGHIEGACITDAQGTHTIATHNLVLATGHSARDTFFMLHEQGVALQQKEFAVGVRIEHLQQDTNFAQYGAFADFKALPAAEYKFAIHPQDARSVFTFCMCPGGSVVGAASETHGVATNGMSAYARNGANSNSALLVNVGAADFGSDDPLAGIAYQRRLEQAAYQLGGGGYIAPAQRVEDFLQNKSSSGPGNVLPTYRPGVRWANLHDCLDEAITHALATALPLMEQKIRGFCAGDAVLTAVESRSSSPVRIPRDAHMQANIRGLYPCGEGAGYAGGIMSAAVDGIRIAECITQQ